MFNALKYTQEMERAGFSRDQAEVSVKILIDVMNENFATKSDLNEVKSELHKVKSELKSEIRELDYKLTIKLGAMLTVAVGSTATIVKLLEAFH